MSNENVDPKIQIKEHVLEFLKELIRQELPTRASNHQETMADTDLLPPFAPPRYESISSFFGNKLSKTNSECIENEHDTPSDPPPPYSKQDVTIAQNQITLVHNNPDRTVIEEIDTEQHLTIFQIREFLRQRLNVNHVQLTYRNRLLNDDSETLSDFGLPLS